MTESLWESDAAVEAGPETVETEPEVNAMAEEVETPQQSAEPRAITVSVTDFEGLEERVQRAVSVVKQERQARASAEERAERSESALAEIIQRTEKMQADVNALRAERDQVRIRVERLLSQLDALEL